MELAFSKVPFLYASFQSQPDLQLCFFWTTCSVWCLCGTQWIRMAKASQRGWLLSKAGSREFMAGYGTRGALSFFRYLKPWNHPFYVGHFDPVPSTHLPFICSTARMESNSSWCSEDLPFVWGSKDAEDAADEIPFFLSLRISRFLNVNLSDLGMGLSWFITFTQGHQPPIPSYHPFPVDDWDRKKCWIYLQSNMAMEHMEHLPFCRWF